jgi:hypothetical protein
MITSLPIRPSGPRPKQSHFEAGILSNADLALLSQPTAFFHAASQKRGCWTDQSSNHPAGIRAAGIGQMPAPLNAPADDCFCVLPDVVELTIELATRRWHRTQPSGR